MPSNQPGPDEVASTVDQTRQVLDALDWPISTSESFRLAWLHSFRTIEIAVLLGVPQGTVKNRILAARKQLQALVPREAFD